MIQKSYPCSRISTQGEEGVYSLFVSALDVQLKLKLEHQEDRYPVVLKAKHFKCFIATDKKDTRRTCPSLGSCKVDKHSPWNCLPCGRYVLYTFIHSFTDFQVPRGCVEDRMHEMSLWNLEYKQTSRKKCHISRHNLTLFIRTLAGRYWRLVYVQALYPSYPCNHLRFLIVMNIELTIVGMRRCSYLSMCPSVHPSGIAISCVRKCNHFHKVCLAGWLKERVTFVTEIPICIHN